MDIATQPPSAPESLAPIAARDRIQALDVIRGFALIGIFLMNVEWFTRPITELGTGVDASQTGIHYFASWFIYTFVQGKFWTMFSLLFGMGFAVMLGRAEDKGREFVKPYVRRIIGLFLFGTLHFTLVWTGDILHNYAFTALALLLVTTRSWKAWLAILASVLVTGGLMFAMGGEYQAMIMTAVFLLLVAAMMHFLARGPLSRYWKWGVTVYSLPFFLGLCWTLGTMAIPQLQPKPTAAQQQEQAKQREERRIERAKERAEEVRIYTQGSYAESIAYRTRQYVTEDLPGAAGLSVLALPMFLIGFWFVRSGVVANLRDHLPLFRRLAVWVFPIGLAMTLFSVWLFPSFVPGTGNRDPMRALAQILFQWGMLPMCLGYVACLVLALHTRLGEKLLSPLRYAGQMALTNYIGANAIGMWFFSGYGLGYWGQVPRAGQVLFVAMVFAPQLAFSMFWLSRYRFGPLEWLWRAITYWQLPPLRRSAAADGLSPAAVA